MIDAHYENKELAEAYLWVCKHLGSKNLSSFKHASYRINEMETNIAEYFREHGDFKNLKISENVCRILKMILKKGIDEAVESAKEENLRNYQEGVESSRKQFFRVGITGRLRTGIRRNRDKI